MNVNFEISRYPNQKFNLKFTLELQKASNKNQKHLNTKFNTNQIAKAQWIKC
jgi:hypothetical protein